MTGSALIGVPDDLDGVGDRGWSDGDAAPDAVAALASPANLPATVEAVAVNAVTAGCRPEYSPVVLAADEAM